jgi:hypothetical protein
MRIADSKTVFLGAVTELELLVRSGFWTELVVFLASVGGTNIVYRGTPVLDLETAMAPFLLGYTSSDEQVLLCMRPQSEEWIPGAFLTIGNREATPFEALHVLYCADGDPAHGVERPHALIANVERGIESRLNMLLRHADSVKNTEYQHSVEEFVLKCAKDLRKIRERLSYPPRFYPGTLFQRTLLRFVMRFWRFA